MRRGVGLVVWGLLALTSVSPPSAAAAPDSVGRDFWFAFLDNPPGTFPVVTPTFDVLVTAASATSGTIEVPGIAYAAAFSVTPGTTTVLTLPAGAELDTADGVQQRAVHVQAAADVTVTTYNHETYSGDTALVMPTDVLGHHTFVMAYGPSATGADPSLASQMAVTATDDDTTVTITPSVTVGAHPAGAPFQVTLARGSAYELRAAPTADLTGTEISSDKPVAVFGGHSCAYVPTTAGYCNHLVEEIPPLEAWGRSFALLPLAGHTHGDEVRILASAADTHVHMTGGDVTLGRGQFVEQLVTAPTAVSADHPILVGQFSTGGSFDNAANDGDPAMVLATPIEQAATGGAVLPTPSGLPSNWITVLAPDADIGSATVDGTPIAAPAITAIPGSGWSGAQVAVQPGAHAVVAPGPFLARAHGFGTTDAYATNGPLLMSPVGSVTTLGLTPATGTRVSGDQDCPIATVRDDAGGALAGIRVDFAVSGTDTTHGSSFSGADGTAPLCFVGHTGTDTISAAVGPVTATAVRTWVTIARVTLDPATATHVLGGQDCSTVGVTGADGAPVGDLAVPVTVAGANPGGGSVTTGADGTARYCYTGGSAGTDTVTAAVGGASASGTRTWTAPGGSPTQPPPTAAPAVPTLLRCTGHAVALTDVTRRGSRVHIGGVALQRYAGQNVSITSQGTPVARTTVRADGTFEVLVRPPAGRTRFAATVGGQSSAALKSSRLLVLAGQKSTGGSVEIRGRLASHHPGRRRLTLRREDGCKPGEIVAVATVTTRADGTFTVRLPRPTGGGAITVYRLRTTTGGRTYTLPVLVRADA